MEALPCPRRSLRAASAVLVAACFPWLGACSEPASNDGGYDPNVVGATGGLASSGGSGTGAASGSTGGLPASGGADASGGSTGGGGGTGASGGMVTVDNPSAGCGMTSLLEPETYVRSEIEVLGINREFYVRLPANYDPMRAYPVVFVGAGCGGNGSNGIPIHQASGNDAIVVGLSPNAQVSGRDCFMTESPTSPEIDYFDAVLELVEGNLCIDQDRVFVEGFSSGSWLTNLLGCARASKIRGQGNASGGLPPLPECEGPVAAIFVHDENDEPNNISGGMAARDRIRTANGCSDQTAPWGGYPECVEYQGCMPGYPVVWCQTSGKGHTDNVPISTEGFWKFWSELE